MTKHKLKLKVPKRAPVIVEPPLRVLVGFIPETSERDAVEFALGVAGRHCTAIDNSMYQVFKWQGGYAYEVHEGGSGNSLLPAVLAEFDRKVSPSELEAGAAPPAVVAFLAAGLRGLKVSRTPTGFAAVALPEDQEVVQSEFVQPGKSLRAVTPRRYGMLISGAIVMGLGALAFISANLGRIQPYEAPPAKVVVTPNIDNLPLGQLPDMLSKMEQGATVTGLEYKAGKWTIASTAATPAPVATGGPLPAAGTSASSKNPQEVKP